MYNLLITGPPGSGKGTQAKLIAKKYKLSHISTGNLLRLEISKNTEIGFHSKKLIENGQLVPDSVVLKLVSEKLKKYHHCVNGFILDGFPRTVNQAILFEDILKFYDTNVAKLIYLRLSVKEIVKRLLERGTIEGRSDDRNEQIIRQRIEEYRSKTRPIIHYYSTKGIISEVNGNDEVEDVFKRICEVIDIK